jgi:hypothetical protein
MELLGDVGHVESRFEIVLASVQECRCKIGAQFASNVAQAHKSF